MEPVLRDLIYDDYLVYLDNVILIGRTFQEQLNNLLKVFRKGVRYLGHIVSPSGVTMDPEKL
jgi:hypothetical protein